MIYKHPGRGPAAITLKHVYIYNYYLYWRWIWWDFRNSHLMQIAKISSSVLSMLPSFYIIYDKLCLCSLYALQWRHNGHDGVSNHQPHDCLFKRLFRRRSKKTSKLRVTGLCVGNSPVTGEFPAQMASNAENVPIWWCHHAYLRLRLRRIFNTQLCMRFHNSIWCCYQIIYFQTICNGLFVTCFVYISYMPNHNTKFLSIQIRAKCIPRRYFSWWTGQYIAQNDSLVF